MYRTGFITIFFASLMFHLSLSAPYAFKKFKSLQKDSHVITNSGSSGCPGGKATDVIILLDTSKYLTKEQFDVQIQRAEHMVRLFRNFNVQDKHYNRITIVAFSGNKIQQIVAKFKKSSKIGPNYTQELANNLRKFHRNHKYDNTVTSRKSHEIHALKYVLRMSRKLRKDVAHVAFYFSADYSVSSTDLKRAERIRKRGIYLYILRLRPSGITFDQYKAMVSSPVTDFVFDVKQHSKIDTSVKELLNMEHCNMQVSPGDDEPRPICEARRPVSLYLGIEEFSLQNQISSILNFSDALNKNLQITNGDIVQTQNIISELSYEAENVNDRYINILEKTVAAVNKNYNKDTQNTLLLFFESGATLTPEIIHGATYLKDHKIEIYAVIKGKSGTDFSTIVSKPAKQHLFNVRNFVKLIGYKDTILKSLCQGW